MNYLELLRLALPEALVTVSALVVLTVGLTKPRSTSVASAIAAAGLLLAGIAVFRLPETASVVGSMLVISPLTSLFKLICLALSFFTVFLAQNDAASRRHHAEYLAIILLATVGLMLLVGSEELLTIFIGLELTGLALYVLTAFDKASSRGAEAALKYFLFGSTASAFTLFGLSFIYGMSGSTTLPEIAQRLAAAPAPPLLMAGIVMTLIGFAFKIAAAPFHLWAGDAYEAAPIPSAAFIASGSKVATFVVLGKVLLLALGPLHGNAAWHAMAAGWSPVLAAIAALSIVVGNLVALAQTNVRRLLAYSAVAHAGYTLLGLIAGGRDGFTATLFYTTTYAFTLLGAFGVVAGVRRQTGGDDFAHFAGLRRRSPVLAGCMAVFMLSLAGLPPLAGFFGKFYLFAAALRSDASQGLLWLVALALLGSLISLYYYLSILKVIFAREGEAAVPRVDGGWLQRVSVVALAAIVIALGVVPSALVTRILQSVP
ncbi:MAG: NADH-quinone oxidoreductase subunit N [Chthoniobacterales bacterium]|nr:NADH-quinone oxidoreductase subunit N [Chthoniobacterales bacterium]